jgi:uroporphyrinogen-III synthase
MKRILITRSRAQADVFAEKLQLAGFEPVYFPVIEIKPIENNLALERALSRLDCYEWILFTSVNTVEVLFDHFPSLQWGAGIKVAAVGPKTAEALKRRGVLADFVPQEYIPEAILPGLGDLLGRWVLLPHGDLARKDLPESIFDAGGVPHEITVYKTLPARPDPESLSALRNGVEVITLTSPSTVQNFMAIARQNGLDPLKLPKDPLFACIGPITKGAAQEAGLPNIVVAKEYTTDGLIAALKDLEAL